MDKPLIEFTDEERALLRKHFDFYKSLSRGWRKATTKAQTHFVEVCRKKATAETPHERAWLKQMSRDALKAKKHSSWDALQVRLKAKGRKSNITHDWRYS